MLLDAFQDLAEMRARPIGATSSAYIAWPQTYGGEGAYLAVHGSS